MLVSMWCVWSEAEMSLVRKKRKKKNLKIETSQDEIKGLSYLNKKHILRLYQTEQEHTPTFRHY